MAKAISRLDEIDQQTQELAESIKESIAELAAQIIPLNERYKRITGEDFVRIDLPTEGVGIGRRRGRPKGSKNGEAIAAKGDKGKRRVRRTTEQLQSQAAEILAFIKKGGDDGVKGSAIRAKFGQILPSIKEFLKLYGGGKMPKTKGQKAAMTYHHAE